MKLFLVFRIFSLCLPRSGVFCSSAYVFSFNKSVEHILATCSNCCGSNSISRYESAANLMKSKLISLHSRAVTATGKLLRAACMFSNNFRIQDPMSNRSICWKRVNSAIALHSKSKSVKRSRLRLMTLTSSFVCS